MVERIQSYFTEETANKKPDHDSILLFLEQEFAQRRERIIGQQSSGRCKKLLARYSCFKDFKYVILHFFF